MTPSGRRSGALIPPVQAYALHQTWCAKGVRTTLVYYAGEHLTGDTAGAPASMVVRPVSFPADRSSSCRSWAVAGRSRPVNIAGTTCALRSAGRPVAGLAAEQAMLSRNRA